jgi:hypothetical protein
MLFICKVHTLEVTIKNFLVNLSKVLLGFFQPSSLSPNKFELVFSRALVQSRVNYMMRRLIIESILIKQMNAQVFGPLMSQTALKG